MLRLQRVALLVTIAFGLPAAVACSTAEPKRASGPIFGDDPDPNALDSGADTGDGAAKEDEDADTGSSEKSDAAKSDAKSDA